MTEEMHDLVAPGAVLPPIALPATDRTEIDLAARAGRCVIVVYPLTGRQGLLDPPNWDDIPGAHGSTPELEGFRDLAGRFAAYDVAILGLSLQTTDYQQEVVERLRLPFSLLSDTEGVFSDALQLPRFKTGGVTYLKRLTLLVSDGVVENVFYPIQDPAGHAAEVIDWLETTD
jgi:peroxiredoxin